MIIAFVFRTMKKRTRIKAHIAYRGRMYPYFSLMDLCYM